MATFDWVLNFTKAAICFEVRCSALKPANFNFHPWTHWTEKITHRMATFPPMDIFKVI
jgi:hypothetical protein